MVEEGDKVAVCNTWRATDSASRRKIEFGGILIGNNVLDSPMARSLLIPRQVYMRYTRYYFSRAHYFVYALI